MNARLVPCLFLLAAALSAAPTSLDVLQHQIDHAAEQGDFSQVEALRRTLAEKLRDAGQYGQAARQYELLLSARPSRGVRVDYFIALGRMREATEDYSGAVSSYQDALHDDPKSWEGNLALARVYARIDLPLKAVEAYQRCIKARPKEREPYQELGEVNQQLGYLDRALDLYKKALAISPMPQTYLKMSDCFMRKGDINRAMDILQQASVKLPAADYDVRLGEILLREGEKEKACRAWEKALKADPRREDMRLQLALLYDQLHRTADADRTFDYLMKTYPQSPLVHFMRAWVLLDRGDRKGSKAEAQLVQSLQPTETVAYYNDRLLAQLQ